MMKSTATLAVLGAAAGVASANQIPAPEGGLAAVSAACPAATTLTVCADYAACAAKCAPAENCPGADYYVAAHYMPGGTLAAGGEYEFCPQYAPCAIFVGAASSPCSSSGGGDSTGDQVPLPAGGTAENPSAGVEAACPTTAATDCTAYQACGAVCIPSLTCPSDEAYYQNVTQYLAGGTLHAPDGIYVHCGEYEACENIDVDVSPCGGTGNTDEAPTGTPPDALNSVEIGQLAVTCALADKAACTAACAPAAACGDASIAYLTAQAALTPPGAWATCIGYQACAVLQGTPTTQAPAEGASGAAGLASYFGTLALAALGSVALQ